MESRVMGNYHARFGVGKIRREHQRITYHY